MGASLLSVDELQRALARCMAAHPPQGIERTLDRDADTLAGLWALLLYERRDSIAMGEVPDDVQAAYLRWREK